MEGAEPEQLVADYLAANGYFVVRLGPTANRGWIRIAMLAVRLRRSTTPDDTTNDIDPALGTDTTRDDLLLVEILPMEPPFSDSPAIAPIAMDALSRFAGITSTQRPRLLRKLIRTGTAETDTGAVVRHIIFWGEGHCVSTPARVISRARAAAYTARLRRAETNSVIDFVAASERHRPPTAHRR